MCSNCRAHFSPFSLIFYSLFLSLNTHLTIAADTISPGQSISGNQTLISKEGNFELGFFTPGNSLNYYIGIWYKKISKQTIIWVANREIPVSDPATSLLKLSKDGNLVLLSNSKIPVWSSNSTPSPSSMSTIAELLDTGNLILRGRSNSSAIVWQSFDHPTDTWVPGGWIGMNKITGEYQSLTSWKNSEDPAPGPFTDSIDPDGTNQFIFLWNKSVSYWRSGVWNGQSFSLLPGMSEGDLYRNKFVDNNERRYFTCTLSNNYTLTRNVMDSSGKVQQWMWFENSVDWMLVWSQPVSPCDVYSVCGTFGICDQGSSPICSCSLGFQPASRREWELNDWSSGCTRKTQLQCGDKNTTSGEKDGFLAMPNVRLPADSQPLMVHSAEECEAACMNNCSCTAYAYESGCSIWNGDIRNLQRLSDGSSGNGTLNLRLAASDLPKPSSKKKIFREVIITVAVGIALSIILGLTWISRRRRRHGALKPVEGPLVSFTYSELQRITKNFSEKLGGGGFGSVSKGVLSDLTAVAVKRLEGLRQGEKQFRSEVSTLGTIQHVNLVRLRGFCCEGTERLLVYDYMPKGSLNNYLFGKESKSLDWKTRYKIMLGIARGLAYLHEECRECIIHCDIKPENILLDSEYCPKVSDFGMAKLVGHDFSRVLTTVRGTIGYLAPEWLGGLPITPKADVYSYGMMLFEVISGKRNAEQNEDGSMRFFPIWAASNVTRGEVLSLLDENLEGYVDMVELNRVCRVACWCIQDSEAQRPSMSTVVHILEGVLEAAVPPMPAILHHLAKEEDRRS